MKNESLIVLNMLHVFFFIGFPFWQCRRGYFCSKNVPAEIMCNFPAFSMLFFFFKDGTLVRFNIQFWLLQQFCQQDHNIKSFGHGEFVWKNNISIFIGDIYSDDDLLAVFSIWQF